MCLPLLAAIPAVVGAIGSAAAATAGAVGAGLGAVGAAAGVTGAGITAGESIAAGAAITAGVAGAGLTAYGQYQQGLAQKKMYDYQSQQQTLQANYDIEIGNAQAQSDEETGNLQNKQLVQNQVQLEGSQKAAEGAAGTGGSVTAENIESSTFTKEQLDQQMLRYNTDLKAYNATETAKGEAWGANVTSKQLSIAGQNSQRAGEISAGGTVLGAASSIANTAVRLQ